MALRWIDGFDWIDADVTGTPLQTVIGKRYPAHNLYYGTDAITRTGVFGSGRALVFRDDDHYIRTPSFVAAEDDLCVVGLHVSARGRDISGVQRLVSFFNSDNELQGYLQVSGAEGFLRYSDNLNLSLFTDEPIVRAHDFAFYCEIKVYFHATAGYVDIRINGEQVLFEENLDTDRYAPTGVDKIAFGTTGNYIPVASSGHYLDDVYICSGAGSDFLGPVRVLHLVPSGDGDDEQWELSTGTDSFTLVYENEPVDGDTTYIYDDTTGQRTLFTCEAVPASMGDNIKGLQICSGVRTDDAALDLKQTAKYSSVLYPQAAQNIASGTFIQALDLMESHPAGGSWTKTNIDNTQFGVEIG